MTYDHHSKPAGLQPSFREQFPELTVSQKRLGAASNTAMKTGGDESVGVRKGPKGVNGTDGAPGKEPPTIAKQKGIKSLVSKAGAVTAAPILAISSLRTISLRTSRDSVQVILKQGSVWKLTSMNDWISKSITLYEENLKISDALGRTDDIPLHEIKSASTSSFVEAHELMQRASSSDDEEAEKGNGHRRARMLSRRSTRAKKSSSMDIIKTSTAVFDVHTVEGGKHSGRCFTFRAESVDECEAWISLLTSQSKKRIKIVEHQTWLDDWRAWTRDTYAHTLTQTFVALLIFFNFVVNAYQAEFDPETMTSKEAEGSHRYHIIDIVLTAFFIVELAFNAFGHWFRSFVTDAWNVFDFLIVMLSLVSLLVDAIPGLNILRVLRAFRLLRLIKRFGSLRRIFDALVLSIVPVLNAFVIGVLITFIYTILGVFLFRDQSPDGFGTFNRSLMTHFLLIAMGRWPDEVQLLDADGDVNVTAFLYLFTFVAIVLWTCLQVVVAVLLDNFLAATQDEKRAEAVKYQLEHRRQGSPLDPLLQKLTDDFDTEDDLSRDIHAVFMILDCDDSGGISNQEMLEGFAKIEVTPRIRLSADDCKAIKQQTLGTTEDQHVTWAQFERMIRILLRTYVQRMMHDAFVINSGDPSTMAVLQGLKLTLLLIGGLNGVLEDADAPALSAKEALAGSESLPSNRPGIVPGLKQPAVVPTGTKGAAPSRRAAAGAADTASTKGIETRMRKMETSISDVQHTLSGMAQILSRLDPDRDASQRGGAGRARGGIVSESTPPLVSTWHHHQGRARSPPPPPPHLANGTREAKMIDALPGPQGAPAASLSEHAVQRNQFAVVDTEWLNMIAERNFDATRSARSRRGSRREPTSDSSQQAVVHEHEVQAGTATVTADMFNTVTADIFKVPF